MTSPDVEARKCTWTGYTTDTPDVARRSIETERRDRPISAQRYPHGVATKKTATAKPTEPKQKAEPVTPEHLGSDPPYAGEASSSARARPYTGCGDPRRWQQRRRTR